MHAVRGGSSSMSKKLPNPWPLEGYDNEITDCGFCLDIKMPPPFPIEATAGVGPAAGLPSNKKGGCDDNDVPVSVGPSVDSIAACRATDVPSVLECKTQEKKSFKFPDHIRGIMEFDIEKSAPEAAKDPAILHAFRVLQDSHWHLRKQLGDASQRILDLTKETANQGVEACTPGEVDVPTDLKLSAIRSQTLEEAKEQHAVTLKASKASATTKKGDNNNDKDTNFLVDGTSELYLPETHVAHGVCWHRIEPQVMINNFKTARNAWQMQSTDPTVILMENCHAQNPHSPLY